MNNQIEKFIEAIENASNQQVSKIRSHLSYAKQSITEYPFKLDPLYEKHEYITDYLKKFGIFPSTKGFYCLRTLLGYVLYEAENSEIPLGYSIHIVASRHQNSIKSVGRCMARDITEAYQKDFTRFDCFNHPWREPYLKEFVYRFMYFTQDLLHMLDFLSDTPNKNSKPISLFAISDYFAKYALPVHHIGYAYLREITIIALSHNDAPLPVVVDEVITLLARKNHTTKFRVIINMCRCIEASLKKCPEYFTEFTDSTKSTLYYQFIEKAVSQLREVT